MISILINAYACAPNKGSEPGMAWNWIINLGEYCKVYVITEGEWQSEIEEALKELPQAENIFFHYNPVSDKIRKMCWNQGDWRFYYYYRKWQKKTLIIAKQIIKENPIDIIHQLNMIGFREPGYLWKIKDKPFIWGPIDAKSKFPIPYLADFSFKSKMFIYLKNFLNSCQLRFSSRIKKALFNSKFVVSASSESIKTFKDYFEINSILINETGCTNIENVAKKSIENGLRLNMLWIGKFELRKQLNLALKTIEKLQNRNIILHIVGGEYDSIKFYKALSDELNIRDQCIWYGEISHKEVQELMSSSDLLFFTSVAEGTPHVVLEAISNNLPVLCFDVCGQGDTVTSNVGIKIPITNPLQSVEDFANEIDNLFKNRNILLDLSKNCKIHRKELSWDKKANKMLELYKQILNSP